LWVIAVCLSFHGTLGTVNEIEPAAPAGPAGDVHPRARRRGRVYLGPWADTGAVSAQDANDSPRVGTTLKNAICAAALRLDDTSGPGGSGNWCVWSRKDATLYPVQAAYVDDAFDTQRRRGVAPTSKQAAF
jgi:hypothetical protein